MKRAVLFLAIAIALIALGMFYNRKADEGIRAETEKEEERIAREEEKLLERVGREDRKIGTGAPAERGGTVSIHYTGMLQDGKKFDSSYGRGEPFSFVIGAGGVIKGMELGVLGMKVGGKRRITIPPDLAYGEKGVPGVIPPNATLTFEVALLEVK